MSKPAEAGEKIPGKWGTSEARFYYDCEGEPVKIELRSGEQVHGSIVGLDAYCIVVERKGQARPMLICKHAINYIQPA